jgi:hypothetical protein
MSHADDVRAYCAKHYVEPALVEGRREFSIRAGDVHEAMGYTARMPLVCAAIGANVFASTNRLRRIAVDGPLNGASTTFVFVFQREADRALEIELFCECRSKLKDGWSVEPRDATGQGSPAMTTSGKW